MTARLQDRLSAAKSAVIAGDSARALTCIEDFAALAHRKGLAPADRPRIEAQIADLRSLAEASLKGARQALDEVQAIVAAARSLQTYDDQGCRQVAVTVAPAPHRF